MSRVILLIIVGAALVGAATAYQFPFTWGQNRSANQMDAANEGTANSRVVQSANQSNQRTAQAPNNVQRTAQAPNNVQRTAQAPNNVGPGGTATTQPAPADNNEPITGLW